VRGRAKNAREFLHFSFCAFSIVRRVSALTCRPLRPKSTGARGPEAGVRARLL
jgi:hypothetical protein